MLNLKYFIPVGFIAFALGITLIFNSGVEKETESEKKEKPQENIDEAEEGRRRVMAEMGRKGAKKRWAKEKAKKEAEAEENEQ